MPPDVSEGVESPVLPDVSEGVESPVLPDASVEASI